MKPLRCDINVLNVKHQPCRAEVETSLLTAVEVETREWCRQQPVLWPVSLLCAPQSTPTHTALSPRSPKLAVNVFFILH
ncbi:hypothetical protein RRG08_014228 [Elysia crispata]|uniref:Uncharacterized protein n=1 Tax=Elysia crispata TaxID=231223 RepID=A0AAE1CET1_9GAST|nr:hypothetical protein RRG08_014228 [Elysia crispata]